MAKIPSELMDKLKSTSRKLMLSSQFPEFCQADASPKQIELMIDLFQQELQYRDDNSKRRLIKKAAFPTVLTSELYNRIDYLKILDEQNRCSCLNGEKYVWVLSTCICILGEYKFFWK